MRVGTGSGRFERRMTSEQQRSHFSVNGIRLEFLSKHNELKYLKSVYRYFASDAMSPLPADLVITGVYKDAQLKPIHGFPYSHGKLRAKIFGEYLSGSFTPRIVSVLSGPPVQTGRLIENLLRVHMIPRGASVLHAGATYSPIDAEAHLYVGPGGSGKTGLALRDFAAGGHLMGDDRLLLSAMGTLEAFPRYVHLRMQQRHSLREFNRGWSKHSWPEDSPGRIRTPRKYERMRVTPRGVSVHLTNPCGLLQCMRAVTLGPQHVRFDPSRVVNSDRRNDTDTEWNRALLNLAAQHDEYVTNQPRWEPIVRRLIAQDHMRQDLWFADLATRK